MDEVSIRSLKDRIGDCYRLQSSYIVSYINYLRSGKARVAGKSHGCEAINILEAGKLGSREMILCLVSDRVVSPVPTRPHDYASGYYDGSDDDDQRVSSVAHISAVIADIFLARNI